MGTIEGALSTVIATLQEILEQRGPRARLEIDYGYEGSDQLMLVFDDTETDAEYDARLQERKKKKAANQKREADAYATYLELKKRFDYRETDA